MSKAIIKIGVLTSSRADYGIYKPLLKKLSKNNSIELTIIVFGMHMLKQHGNTVENIIEDNFGQIHQVVGMPKEDTTLAIATGYGEMIKNFSEYWNTHQYEWVIALGDRFEMSAAVQAGIPFEVNFAHLHGGETTLGAIDNIYRHQITLASKMHFAASDVFVKRITELIDNNAKVYNVGALSLDGLSELELPSWRYVATNFKIPTSPFLLVTFHPETVGLEKNKKYSEVMYNVLSSLCKSIHIVITLANADAMGSLYRQESKKLKELFPSKISLVDNFGRENYFAAIKASSLLLGNTSSGILEAASFEKYVINVGDRQKGRLRSKNVIDVPFNEAMIIKETQKMLTKGSFKGLNKYFKPDASKNIIEKLINA